MTAKVRERIEIDAQFKWNSESLYANEAEWQADLVKVREALADVERFHQRLGANPQALLEWFSYSAELMRRIGRLSVYAGMSRSVDMTDEPASARFSEMLNLYALFHAGTAFAEPEILSIPSETLGEWFERTPELQVYSHYFDALDRRRFHVRSAEVEELLGQVGAPFSSARQVHGFLSDADLNFSLAIDSEGQAIEVTQGTIGSLLTSPDPALRRSAFENYADGFLSLRNGMAACIETGVKQNIFRARTRHYSSALEAATQSNNIPTSVFHKLINTYRANLPIWHRYWELHRKALGSDKLAVCDIKAPLGAQTPHVPYLQAVDWICDGMAPLGEEYVRLMRKGLLEERWVDVYPNRGKRLGAFSSGSQGTHPFIMMSYSEDLFGLSTLAHELGHSMHSYYAWREQPIINSSYGLFVAEVASNFNQALVRAHLLNTVSDRDFQIALIEEAMANFHRYFFVMPILARFELEIHERVERGEALTAQRLMDLMAELFREGYGPAVEIDAKRVGITWAQFHTHLYSNFYVYQYATGISGAHALANGVLKAGAPAAERYLDFLKAGGSLYPLDALKLAGVDLSTSEAVDQTFAVLESYVALLEKLV